MKLQKLILLLPLFILSCTTVEFVRKESLPKKQAILRYTPTSNREREMKYRDEVKKKATEFCNGDYEITKEYQAREETGTSAGVGTGVAFGMGGIMLGGSNRNTAMYNFVEFACK